MEIMHPRPSPIAAAMYTLRDLGVEAIILHGPPGCNFRTSRILEDDGIRVFTTAMLEYDFIFGGRKKFLDLLKRIDEKFSFNLIGVVGTCGSMIIGEDVEATIKSANLKTKIIVVETHGGYGDNTVGAIQTLQAAVKGGLISNEELKRQEKLLKKATEIEKGSGMASMEYIAPSKGDDKIKIAREIIESIKKGEFLVVMNAKKELGYIFSDIILAMNEIAKKYDSRIINIANVDPKIGLPRIREYAKNILRDLKRDGVKIDHITGGLDEYPIAGEVASKIISDKYGDIDNSLIIGNPHGVPVPVENKGIAVTNGPREVAPLKKMGYDKVVVELDAHSLVVGVNSIVPSDFGSTLRSVFELG